MSSINNNIASVNKMEKILHSNLMNLKNCLEPISLDQFVVSTLEALRDCCIPNYILLYLPFFV